MIIDFRKSCTESVMSTKFFGIHFMEDLTWTSNTGSLTKRAYQHLHILLPLMKANIPPPVHTMFYRGTIKSVLTSCLTL